MGNLPTTWKEAIRRVALDLYSDLLGQIAKYVPEYRLKDAKMKEQERVLAGRERDLITIRGKVSKLERELEKAGIERTQLNLEKKAMGVKLVQAEESYNGQLAVYQGGIEESQREANQLRTENTKLASELASLKILNKSDREGVSGLILNYLDNCYHLRLTGNKGELIDSEAVGGQLGAARQEIIDHPQKYKGLSISLRGIRILSPEVAQEINLYAKSVSLEDGRSTTLVGVSKEIYRTLRKAGFERDDMIS